MGTQHGSSAWAEVAATPYVSLGTYRRNGEVVATPVWVAALPDSEGDALVVTTEVSTGKVKRLRRDPRVILRPCGRTGKVDPGAPTVEGHCEIVEPEDAQQPGIAALRRKYGLQYEAVLRIERLVRGVQRKRADRVILRITR